MSEYTTALDHLRRLASPDEMGGTGDATDAHNDTPEMRARLRYAQMAVEEVALHESLARGLAQSGRGEVHDLGSFARYADPATAQGEADL